MKLQNGSPFKTALALSVAAFAISSAAIAQEETGTSSSDEDRERRVTQGDQQPDQEEDALKQDVIVVQGIRGSLENALEIKRNADVIVDGISADDVGSTPDLNLGEALQRIPGVQINRSAERRDATITVRGLPGRFAKTTVMGQEIATPAGRRNATSSPFGIFDASIFSGANVVKSFSSEIISGGLAANVDLRLRSALERKDGSYVLRAESQYEESTKDSNPGLFFTGSKHFLDGRLGVWGTGSIAAQSFRRDSILINGYTPYNAGRVAEFADQGITADDTVLHPNLIRQFTQTNSGDRLSFGAGVEYEASPNLNLRLDGIFTERELDDANLDIFFTWADDRFGPVTPTAPARLAGVFDRDGDGTAENVYVTPQITFEDARTSAGNRNFPSKDTSWAIYPQLDWEVAGWDVNLIGTYSEAEGLLTETLWEARRQPNRGRDVLNGIVGTVNTGFGDFGAFEVDVDIPPGAITLEGGDWRVSTRNFIQATNEAGTTFVAGGATSVINRDLMSLDLKAKRELDIGPLTTFKVGARYQDENADQFYQETGILGLQLGNLTDDVLRLNEAVTSGGAFFGNEVPGVTLQNFLSLDLGLLNSQVRPIVLGQVATGTDVATFLPGTGGDGDIEAPLEEVTGLVQRLPLTRTNELNYVAQRTSTEAFIMQSFDFTGFEHLNVPVRGNLGLRYVETDLSGRIDIAPSSEPDAEGTYDAWLPSVNLIVDITDDIVARAAYYETFEALDLAEFSPAPTQILESPAEPGESVGGVIINVSTLDLEPRTSEAFDLGLSWYNRKGSVVGLGYFQKDVRANIVRQRICPEAGAFGFGPLFVDSAEVCRIDDGAANELDNRRIAITETVNLPDTIKVEGWEFQVQQNLDFLPGIWGNFGGIFNYTNVTSGSDSDFKLFNVADNTFNLIGYYEDDLLSARLAYNYVSDNELQGTGSFTGSDRFVKERGQLDLSVGVRPIENLEVRFEAFNLTNELREEYEFVESLNRRADLDGRTYSVSLQYKF